MRTSVLLRKVRDFFKKKGEKGWTRNDLYSEGAYCINGAVNKILYNNPDHYNIYSDPVYERLADALLTNSERRTSDTPALMLANWNNSSNYETVMSRLEKACREHR